MKAFCHSVNVHGLLVVFADGEVIKLFVLTGGGDPKT